MRLSSKSPNQRLINVFMSDLNPLTNENIFSPSEVKLHPTVSSNKVYIF